MKKKVIIILSVLLFLGIGAYIALYFIGGFIIDESIDLSLSEESLLTDTTSESALGISSSAVTASVLPNSSSNSSSSSTPSAIAPVTIPDNTLSTAGDKNNGSTTKPAISVDKMQEIKDKVTATDKVSTATMVLSRLSASDVNELKSLIPGGLTDAEKARAKQICYANFSSEEIVKIKQIYKKYMNENGDKQDN